MVHADIEAEAVKDAAIACAIRAEGTVEDAVVFIIVVYKDTDRGRPIVDLELGVGLGEISFDRVNDGLATDVGTDGVERLNSILSVASVALLDEGTVEVRHHLSVSRAPQSVLRIIYI